MTVVTTTRNNPPCNKLLSADSAWQYTIKSKKLWSSLLCTISFHSQWPGPKCSHQTSVPTPPQSVLRDAGIHAYMKEHATLHTLIPVEIPILHPGYGCQYHSTQHNSWFLSASCWFHAWLSLSPWRCKTLVDLHQATMCKKTKQYTLHCRIICPKSITRPFTSKWNIMQNTRMWVTVTSFAQISLEIHNTFLGQTLHTVYTALSG
jgi:hypothetical protein